MVLRVLLVGDEELEHRVGDEDERIGVASANRVSTVRLGEKEDRRVRGRCEVRLARTGVSVQKDRDRSASERTRCDALREEAGRTGVAIVYHPRSPLVLVVAEVTSAEGVEPELDEEGSRRHDRNGRRS